MFTRMTPLVGTLAAGAALVGAAILGAGTASADATQDAKFLSALSSNGVPVADPAVAVSNAQVVCNKLDDGATFDATANQFSAANPSYSPTQVGEFMGAAIGVYCPMNGSLIPS